ncbi:hypothetical protein FWH13_03515 [Candidatus Saccharibacteria bacterium]|nr:hypothetical protein [Candidatus Saccharibacteria bacterium]
MKARIFYRKRQDYTRTVEMYIADFYKNTGREIEVCSPDGRENANIVDLYDLNRLPAILVTSSDGRVLYRHLGMPLPLMRDIALWMERG